VTLTAETRAAINAAAKKAAREAVRETLLMLGVDASTPEAIREAQQDFAFARKLRVMAGVKSLRYSIIVFSTVCTLLGAVLATVIKSALES
jgi:hypothetical protein